MTVGLEVTQLGGAVMGSMYVGNTKRKIAEGKLISRRARRTQRD